MHTIEGGHVYKLETDEVIIKLAGMCLGFFQESFYWKVNSGCRDLYVNNDFLYALLCNDVQIAVVIFAFYNHEH